MDKHYEHLRKVKDQACHFIGYMKGSLEYLDNFDKEESPYSTKEEIKDRVILALREQLKELEDVIKNR